MFRQAALMMSPAKTTGVAAVRGSPTPSKKVVAALSAAIRSASPKPAATKKAQATKGASSPKAAAKKAALSSTPKKVAFDAKIAAQTKAALSGMFVEKKVSPKKTAASSSPVKSPKNKKTLSASPKKNGKKSKKSAVDLQDNQVDDSLIDYDATYDALATIRAEILMPAAEAEEVSAATTVSSSAKAADGLAVELFSEEIGAGATETARALMELAATPIAPSISEPVIEASESLSVTAESPALDIPVAEASAPALTNVSNVTAAATIVIPNQLPSQFAAGNNSASKITCHDLNTKMMDILFSAPTTTSSTSSISDTPVVAAAITSHQVIQESFPFTNNGAE